MVDIKNFTVDQNNSLERCHSFTTKVMWELGYNGGNQILSFNINNARKD